jgi:pimeloyl-ACP methyl ester carboxylesterase
MLSVERLTVLGRDTPDASGVNPMTATGQSTAEECLQCRVHGAASLPTLIYLPGLHGDWTLVSSFRAAVSGRVRFVEFTYPRTVRWSLDDYAAAIQNALQRQGVRRGWLLGESFGSQIVWPLLARTPAGSDPTERPGGEFEAEGVILAGGFVRHPVPWGVRLASRLCAGAPGGLVRWSLTFYAQFAKFRHRHAPETLANLHEFIARRTELDRQAVVHRLRLIVSRDPRPVARHLHLPVYYLAGALDPLVPWPWVRGWLRRECPGYRGGRTLWRADHNVLGTAPGAAVEQVLRWMNQYA